MCQVSSKCASLASHRKKIQEQAIISESIFIQGDNTLHRQSMGLLRRPEASRDGVVLESESVPGVLSFYGFSNFIC